jgi:hypothetical protein
MPGPLSPAMSTFTWFYVKPENKKTLFLLRHIDEGIVTVPCFFIGDLRLTVN